MIGLFVGWLCSTVQWLTFLQPLLTRILALTWKFIAFSVHTSSCPLIPQFSSFRYRKLKRLYVCLCYFNKVFRSVLLLIAGIEQREYFIGAHLSIYLRALGTHQNISNGKKAFYSGHRNSSFRALHNPYRTYRKYVCWLVCRLSSRRILVFRKLIRV